MNLIKAGAIALAALSLTACGSNGLQGIIDAIELRTYEHPITRHNYIEVKAEFDNSNMIFPMAYMTVVDPKNPQRELGTIEMKTDFNGKNTLVVNADISGFRLGDYVSDGRLPNGNPIPVVGLDRVLALNVKDGNTRLYIGEQQGQVVVGVAVAIKEFDGLAASIPNANIFFALPGNSKISGVAGFFTGSQTSQSGVALFAKGSLVSPAASRTLTKISDNGPKFLISKPSTTQLWKTQNFFWNLNRKGGKLHIAK